MRPRPTSSALLALLATLAPAQSAPDIDAARRVVANLDAALSNGDREAFERWFAPLHREHYERLVERLAPLFRPDLGIRRSSEIERYWTRSGSGVAVVRSETSRDTTAERPRRVVENLMLVVAGDADGEPRARLCVELDPDWLQHVQPAGPDGGIELTCSVCNYALDVPDPWLAVPNCRLRSGCLESYTLFALDLDLTATFSVHVFPEPADPVSLLTALTIAEAGPRVDGTISPVRDWTPPCATATVDLRGAMCRVDEPEAARATELRVLTFGRVGYLMAASGPVAVLAAADERLTTLFGSLRMVDPDVDPDRLAERVLTAHVGGRLDEDVYVNDRHRVRIAGPAGWACRLDAGQYAFDVTWDCPAERGSLRAKALEPPIGAATWTRPAADRTLDEALRGEGLPARSDTGWTDAGAGGFSSVRALELERPDGRLLLLRFGLAPDLLVVLQGDVKDEAARPAIRGAMDSLSRTR